jgi:hypothetical protein
MNKPYIIFELYQLPQKVRHDQRKKHIQSNDQLGKEYFYLHSIYSLAFDMSTIEAKTKSESSADQVEVQ